MFVRLLISWFGTAVVCRTLSLLENSEVVTPKKFKILFFWLHLPLYLHLVFKELREWTLSYIGIFLLTFMLYPQIIIFFRQKTFEKLHFDVVDRLLLLVKTGKSAQMSVKTVCEEFTSWEKVIFEGLLCIFEKKPGAKERFLPTESFFFDELAEILRAPANVGGQLRSFRDALRVQQRLRHKSKQALRQARAQAVVCAGLYVAVFVMSRFYFHLEMQAPSFWLSLALLIAGQILILRIGERRHWKT